MLGLFVVCDNLKQWLPISRRLISVLLFRDDTPHIYNETYLDQDRVFDIISDITDLLQEVFPDTIVYSALGNHDWSPKSQLPPHSHPLYDRIAEKWQNWITQTGASDTFKKGISTHKRFLAICSSRSTDGSPSLNSVYVLFCRRLLHVAC